MKDVLKNRIINLFPATLKDKAGDLLLAANPMKRPQPTLSKS